MFRFTFESVATALFLCDDWRFTELKLNGLGTVTFLTVEEHFGLVKEVLVNNGFSTLCTVLTNMFEEGAE